MIVLELTAGRYSYPGSLSFGFMFFVFWSTAAAIGAYLRYQQERREEAVKAVRRAERLVPRVKLHRRRRGAPPRGEVEPGSQVAAAVEAVLEVGEAPGRDEDGSRDGVDRCRG